MCTVCGCGQGGGGTLEGAHGHADGHRDDRHRAHPRGHALPHGLDHAHGHDHDHGNHEHSHNHHSYSPAAAGDAGALDFGGALGVHVPGMSPTRVIEIERNILGENDRLAAENRSFLARRGAFALNLMSSPGSGKTTLLVRTIGDLAGRFPLAVIEGDQQTSVDAERIRAQGVETVQINTGRGCHLDAHMVGHALQRLDPAENGIVFIENVGNLVCPSAFDLGEAAKVVILSVTEGEDKPLKYPDMFHAAALMLINKVDLLPYVAFDVDRCVAYARRINPTIDVLTVSATSGEGLEAWCAWIGRRQAALIDPLTDPESRVATVRP